MGLFLTRTVWRFREQFVWYRTICTALASQTQCLYIRVCGMSALHPWRTFRLKKGLLLALVRGDVLQQLPDHHRLTMSLRLLDRRQVRIKPR